jgi:alpha-L-rhamnosidase
MKNISDWTDEAVWIGGNNLLRTDFSLPSPASSAVLRIAGLGYFELYVNGSKIGDQVLAPVQTDYDCRVFYLSFEVSEQLCTGLNTIGMMLGEGFFAQSLVRGRYGWPENPYGEKRLRLQLDVTCTDSSVHRVVSGPQWLTAGGPIISDNVYAGEVYDARREIPGWAEALPINADLWKPATLLAAPGGIMLNQDEKIEPCRIIRLIRPAAVTYPDTDTAVFDLGENIAGWARIQVNEPAGTRLELQFAEELDESGHLDPASTGVFATECIQTDVYICRGDAGGESWEPRFTYHGFRFAALRGWTRKPKPENLSGVVVHSAVAPNGEFHCSHRFLNTLYEMARRTLLGNLHGVPTDCPARERCGWLGDAQIMAEFAICNFNMEKFWRKYMDDIATSSVNGVPSMIAPGRRGRSEAAPGWGSTAVQLPWYLYLYYGDKATLNKHYDLIKSWISHLSGKAKAGIVDYGFGDWCPPGSVYPRETPKALTSTAYYYYDVQLAARIAAINGRHAEAAKYTALADAIKTAFQQRFYLPERHSFGSQTADAFALFLGLVPEGSEQLTADALARDITEKHNGHFSTGITGLKYLFGELCRYGYEDLAVETICRPGYPGFADLCSQGATTFWETWEKNPADEPTPRSRNHPMQAGFAAWFHQSLCGVQPAPEAPAFRQTIIAPVFPEAVEWASASQDSKYGRITCSWRRRQDKVKVKIRIPDGCRGTFIPPAKWCINTGENKPLSGGGHSFILSSTNKI